MRFPAIAPHDIVGMATLAFVSVASSALHKLVIVLVYVKKLMAC